MSDNQAAQGRDEVPSQPVAGNPPGVFTELKPVMVAGVHPAAHALTTLDPTGSTLSQVVGEPIVTTVSSQAQRPLPWPLEELEAVVQQEPVLLQTARQRGGRTGRVWRKTASVLLTARVDRALVARLTSDEALTTLQALWEAYPETARYEAVRWHCGPGGPKTTAFGLPPAAALIIQTLRVVANGRPVALVEETFPAEDAWPEATSPAREAT